MTTLGQRSAAGVGAAGMESAGSIPATRTNAPFVYRFRTTPFHGVKRGSIPLWCTICLVLSRYRVWTHTLFGPNWRGTGPDITA